MFITYQSFRRPLAPEELNIADPGEDLAGFETGSFVTALTADRYLVESHFPSVEAKVFNKLPAVNG